MKIPVTTNTGTVDTSFMLAAGGAASFSKACAIINDNEISPTGYIVSGYFKDKSSNKDFFGMYLSHISLSGNQDWSMEP